MSPLEDTSPGANCEMLATRVTPEIKAEFRQLAAEEYRTPAAELRALVVEYVKSKTGEHND